MMIIFCNLVLGVKELDSNEHSILFLNKNLQKSDKNISL